MLKNRIIATLLCALLVFSLAACKTADQTQSPEPSPTSTGEPNQTGQSASLDAIYAMHAPDTVVLTIGGDEITWETLFYFVEYSVYQIVGSADNVTSWAEPYPYGTGETLQQAVLDSAEAILLQNKAVEHGAQLMNIELTEEDRKAIDTDWQELVATYGEEELLKILQEQYCTKELYLWILETSRLLEKCLSETFGLHGEKISEADMAEFAGTEDYMMAKHILIKTLKTDESGKDVAMTDEEKAAALEKAEDILAEIEAYSGSDFGTFFDGLVKEHSEDPGSIANPGGYLFTKGNMVTEFENATRALKVGEHSGLVESQFGYHIINRVPIDYSAVPIAYSSYGGEYTLRTITAYGMFQSVLEGWQQDLEISYSDTYIALNFDAAAPAAPTESGEAK